VESDLDVHLVLDNYGTHKHPAFQKWLATRPRYHVHFTPTGSSWLNQIERWFAEITRKRIRRGTFHTVGDLIKAIQDYIRLYNKNPQPFHWVASAGRIIRKVRKYKETSDTAAVRRLPLPEGSCPIERAEDHIRGLVSLLGPTYKTREMELQTVPSESQIATASIFLIGHFVPKGPRRPPASMRDCARYAITYRVLLHLNRIRCLAILR
jgi:hypothetical protein